MSSDESPPSDARDDRLKQTPPGFKTVKIVSDRSTDLQSVWQRNLYRCSACLGWNAARRKGVKTMLRPGHIALRHFQRVQRCH